MAKGQKRSNREVKKPKKTAADRAKTDADRASGTSPVIGSFSKGARDGQTRR